MIRHSTARKTIAVVVTASFLCSVSPQSIADQPTAPIAKKVIAQTTRPSNTFRGPRQRLPELVNRRPPRSIEHAHRLFHLSGARSTGPLMSERRLDALHPPGDPRAMSAQYRQLHGISVPASPEATAAPRVQLRTFAPSGTNRAPAATRRLLTVNTGSAPLSGLNSWWTYEGGPIPGVGQYYANVGVGGNLLIQAVDMSIPHKGVPLVFQRSYNSLSQHDYFATDGAQTISNYGASWTNSFDMHVAQNSGNGYGSGLSVYDADGSRYDYLADGQGNWIPPAGQFAKLVANGSSEYDWIKKSGVTYRFYAPTGVAAGYAGRLYRIVGRNANTYLQFSYNWTNGDASCSCNLTDVYVTEEDGVRSAHLTFVDFQVNGQNQRLLSTLIWPNAATVAYNYDAYGNLDEVDEPPNNTSSSNCYGGISLCLPQWYVYNPPSYAPGYSLMSWVETPRLVMYNEGYTEPAGPSGTGVTFGYDLNHGNAIVGIAGYGYMNPSPPDGTGTAVQSGVSNGDNMYRYVGFSRDYVSSTNAWDSDGHSHTYSYDGLGRVTQIQLGVTSTEMLYGNQTWDSQNNLLSTTDPRGNETDYAYDNYGNLIASAFPSVSTSDGTFRPTTVYSYDQYNNVTAACDPRFSHFHSPSLDWTSRPSPSDSLCPAQLGSQTSPGSSYLSWSPTSADQYGQLQTVTNAAGYTTSFYYSPTYEGGGSVDYDLATTISGSAFTQYDNSNAQPSTSITYDTYGDALAVNNGQGSSSASYDTVGRVTRVTDADSHQSFLTYYADGLVQLAQTPPQYAAGTGVSYYYDADGDPIQENHNFTCIPGNSCTQGATYRYYDGADRLVEVSLPNNSTDYYPYPWLTRYFYDLTQGSNVTIGSFQYGSASFRAYGNMFKQQTCANAAIQSYNNPGSGCSWLDQKGNAFDGLDRAAAQYAYQPGGNLQSTTTTYDATSATLGLATSTQNALGETTSYAYDAIGNLASISFANSYPNVYYSVQTPSRTYTYDGDSRVSSIYSPAFGTESFSYTPDGNVASLTEPTGGSGIVYDGYDTFANSLSSPSVTSYSYYPNGWRVGVNISSASLSQTNFKQYSYRSDGLLQRRSFNANGYALWQAFTYTSAGRQTAIADNYNASAENLTYDQYGQLSTFQIAYGSTNVATYSSIQHDLEGKVLSYNINPAYEGSYGGPTSLSNNYNIRGELLGTSCGVINTTCPAASAHGFLYPPDNTNYCVNYGRFDAGTACGTEYTTFDARNGAGLGTFVHFTSFDDGDPRNQGQRPTDSQYASPESYDRVGRNGQNQYDMENHVVSSSWNGSLRDAFGPDGNLLFSWYSNGSTNYKLTHHWDGNALLMTTDSSGAVQDVLFDKTANMTPQASYTGPSFWDRDFSGTIVTAHNPTGYGGASYVANSTLPYCAAPNLLGSSGFNMGGPCSGSGVIQSLLHFWRTDGYFDGTNVIQGVRGYRGNSGQWASMDAYGGNPMDPMSTQPYVWNGNDPNSDTDPSGFIPGGRAAPIDEPEPNCVSDDSCAPVVVGLGPWSIQGPIPMDKTLREIARVIARIRNPQAVSASITGMRPCPAPYLGCGAGFQGSLDTCARVYGGGHVATGVPAGAGGYIGPTWVFPGGQSPIDMPTSTQTRNVISAYSRAVTIQGLFLAGSLGWNDYGSALTIGVGPSSPTISVSHGFNAGPVQLGIGCK